MVGVVVEVGVVMVRVRVEVVIVVVVVGVIVVVVVEVMGRERVWGDASRHRLCGGIGMLSDGENGSGKGSGRGGVE